MNKVINIKSIFSLFAFAILLFGGLGTATRALAQKAPSGGTTTSVAVRIAEVTSYNQDNTPATINVYGSGLGTNPANITVTLAGTPLTGIVLSSASGTEVISANVPTGNWLPGSYVLNVL